MCRLCGHSVAFYISGSGDDSKACFELVVCDKLHEHDEECTIRTSGEIPLDGGKHDPDEWVREVLAGLVEKL